MKSEEKEELVSGLFVAGLTAIAGFGLFSLLKYLARKDGNGGVKVERVAV